MCKLTLNVLTLILISSLSIFCNGVLAECITNGGFEDDTWAYPTVGPVNWSCFYYSNEVVWGPGQGHNSNNSLLIRHANNNGLNVATVPGYEQSFTIPAGTNRLRFEFWVKSDTGGKLNARIRELTGDPYYLPRYYNGSSWVQATDAIYHQWRSSDWQADFGSAARSQHTIQAIGTATWTKYQIYMPALAQVTDYKLELMADPCDQSKLLYIDDVSVTAEYTINGGFESNTWAYPDTSPVNWSCFYYSNEVVWGPGQGHDSSNSLLIRHANNSGGNIASVPGYEQSFTIPADTTCLHFEFWVKSDAGARINARLRELNGTPSHLPRYYNGNEWIQATNAIYYQWRSSDWQGDFGSAARTHYTIQTTGTSTWTRYQIDLPSLDQVTDYKVELMADPCDQGRLLYIDDISISKQTNNQIYYTILGQSLVNPSCSIQTKINNAAKLGLAGPVANCALSYLQQTANDQNLYVRAYVNWAIEKINPRQPADPVYTYHVATNNPQANDNNPGTASLPWKTIQKAAETLRPGDTVLIHSGTYREDVRPFREGTNSTDRMIHYQAATGEYPVITGADIWQPQWTDRGSGCWSAAYTRHSWDTWDMGVSDPNRVMALRCEQIIVDGVSLKQVATTSLLNQSVNTFYADETNHLIWIHIAGSTSPAQRTVERSMRRQLFWPAVTGLGYIHVQGLTFTYSAGLILTDQTFATAGYQALVSIKNGHHWLIENNSFKRANAQGLDLSYGSYTIDPFTLPVIKTITGGYNQVSNNSASYNGTTGFAGTLNSENGQFDIIADNEISYNGLKNDFYGYESAGIKFHTACDVTIRRNYIHDNESFGIWLDWDNKRTRITQCIITNNVGAGIFYEESPSEDPCNPSVIFGHMADNNVILNTRSCPPNTWGENWADGIYSHGGNHIIAINNFIAGCANYGIRFKGSCDRVGPNGRTTTISHNRFYNNYIFESTNGSIATNYDLPHATDNRSNYNVFWNNGNKIYMTLLDWGQMAFDSRTWASTQIYNDMNQQLSQPGNNIANIPLELWQHSDVNKDASSVVVPESLLFANRDPNTIRTTLTNLWPGSFPALTAAYGGDDTSISPQSTSILVGLCSELQNATMVWTNWVSPADKAISLWTTATGTKALCWTGYSNNGGFEANTWAYPDAGPANWDCFYYSNYILNGPGSGRYVGQGQYSSKSLQIQHAPNSGSNVASVPGYQQTVTISPAETTLHLEFWLKSEFGGKVNARIRELNGNPYYLPRYYNGSSWIQATDAIFHQWRTSDWEGDFGSAALPHHTVQAVGTAAWTKHQINLSPLALVTDYKLELMGDPCDQGSLMFLDDVGLWGFSWIGSCPNASVTNQTATNISAGGSAVITLPTTGAQVALGGVNATINGTQMTVTVPGTTPPGVYAIMVISGSNWLNYPINVLPKYTEKCNDITIGAAGTWMDVDLSSYGVLANQVVEIGLRNSSTSAARLAGVRIKGSSLNRYVTLRAAATTGWDTTVMQVKTDANKKIQAYAANTTDVHIILLGTWGMGNYTEKFQTLTINTTGAWTDSADLSTYGVTANQVIELLAANTSTTAYIAGVRAKGSALERKLTLRTSTSGARECLVMKTQVDASRKLQVWKGNTAVTFTLLGYWTTPPGTYTEKFVDVGKPTSSATWYTRSLSGQGVPSYSLCEFLIASAATANSDNVGVRAVGSGLSRLYNLHRSSASMARSCSMMHTLTDGGSQIQQYLQNQADTVNFYLLGYWN